ncbi:MAG: hypothetical protein ACHQ49_09770 [Elusimicrobiota bacterium]
MDKIDLGLKSKVCGKCGYSIRPRDARWRLCNYAACPKTSCTGETTERIRRDFRGGDGEDTLSLRVCTSCGVKVARFCEEHNDGNRVNHRFLELSDEAFAMLEGDPDRIFKPEIWNEGSRLILEAVFFFGGRRLS